MKKNYWILLVVLFFQLPVTAQNDTIIRHYNDTTFRQLTDTVMTIISVPDSTLKQRVEIISADSADRPVPSDAKLVLHNATADKMLPTYNLYDRTDTFYVKGDRPGHPTGTSTKKAPRSLRQRA